jgi:hypothetical protein
LEIKLGQGNPLDFIIRKKAPSEKYPTELPLRDASPELQQATFDLIKRAAVASFHPDSILRMLFYPPVGASG